VTVFLEVFAAVGVEEDATHFSGEMVSQATSLPTQVNLRAVHRWPIEHKKSVHASYHSHR
jgi:hypothetical protein